MMHLSDSRHDFEEMELSEVGLSEMRFPTACRSIVWNFYERLEDNRVRCQFCDGVFQHHRKTTTNLLNHLKAKHPEYVKKAQKRRTKVDDMLETPSLIQQQKQQLELRAPTDHHLSLENQSTKTAQVESVMLANHEKEKYPPEETKSAPETEMAAERQVLTDELICRFLVRNGLAYDTVRDPTLLQAIWNLNKNYNLPTPCAMEGVIERLAHPSKPPIDGRLVYGGYTATVDVYEVNEEVFLAYSLHFFEDSSKRKNLVFLEKMVGCEMSPMVIMSSLRKSINEYQFNGIIIDQVITTNIFFKKEFLDTRAAKEGTLCFFSIISTFAEELINLPDFKTPLHDIREFIRMIRREDDLYHKFERFLMSRRVVFTIPDLDSDKWRSTATFLTRSMQMHRMFHEFSKRRQLNYLSCDAYINLAYLQSMLTVIDRFGKELSGSDSTLSLIIPAITAIKEHVDNNAHDLDLTAKVQTLFQTCLYPILEQVDSQYHFATMLDPRFGYRDSIFEEHKWFQIHDHFKTILKKTVSLQSDDEKFNDANDDSGELRESVLDPASVKNRIDAALNELRQYHAMITCSRPQCVINPCEWWASRRKTFPFLHLKAFEYLRQPACAIDAEYFFGPQGKFSHMNSKLSFQQMSAALKLASQMEKYRGRGSPEEQKKLEPFQYGRKASSPDAPKKKLPPSVRLPREVQVPNNNVRFNSVIDTSNSKFAEIADEVKQEDPGEEDGFLKSMMMQPPDNKKECFAPADENALADPKTESDEVFDVKVKVETVVDTVLKTEPVDDSDTSDTAIKNNDDPSSSNSAPQFLVINHETPPSVLEKAPHRLTHAERLSLLQKATSTDVHPQKQSMRPQALEIGSTKHEVCSSRSDQYVTYGLPPVRPNANPQRRVVVIRQPMKRAAMNQALTKCAQRERVGKPEETSANTPAPKVPRTIGVVENYKNKYQTMRAQQENSKITFTNANIPVELLTGTSAEPTVGTHLRTQLRKPL